VSTLPPSNACEPLGRTAWYERHWCWLALAIVAAVTVLCLLLVDSVWLASPDAVKYASSARALARGDGYLFNGGREAKHPPGFPLLLAVFFRVAPDPLLAGRVMIVLTAAVALYLAGVVLRRTLGAGVSLVALICVAVSVSLWWSTQALLSEYPFALFQNLALLALLRWASGASPRTRDALGFGLATSAALLMRSLAVALLIAGAYTIVRQRLARRITTRRAAVLAVAALGLPLATFGVWRLYTSFYVGAAVPENLHILRQGYAGDGTTSPLAVVLETTSNLLSDAGGLLLGEFNPRQYPSAAPWLWLALVGLWLPVAVALAVRGAGRAEPVWAFLGIYLAMIALWPLAANATARLCWPVVPLVAGLLLASWRWLAGRVGGRRGPAVVTALLVLGVCVGQLTFGRGVWQRMREGEAFWTVRLADLRQIRDTFRPAPPAVWAHLNVREAVYVFDLSTTVMEFGWRKNPERWAREVNEYQPEYIVVPTAPSQIDNTRRFLETLAQQRPATTCVAEGRTVSLYHVPPTSSPAVPPDRR
jgi:hypothetical protein